MNYIKIFLVEYVFSETQQGSKFYEPGFQKHAVQELIQKEKVHIDCEKGARNNIVANQIATQ